ncbi:hypothetical protein [Rhizobium phage RHph_X2_24]|nr:hypothetical protein [Rhizobium phage RHph_X2_24]
MNGEENPMPVTLEKARVNVWNLGGFIVSIVFAAFGWGVTYNSMTNADAVNKASIEQLSNDVKDISAQIPLIAQLQFQMTRTTEQLMENKSSITETNKRVDRIVESFGGKLDVITEGMNKIATRVEVLSTQIGGEPKPQRTRFTVRPKL